MNITELINYLQRRTASEEEQRAAEALLAQQETILQQQIVIKQMLEALAGMEKWASKVHDGYPKTTASMYAEPFRKTAQKALARQPDLSALREHDAEVVTQCYYVVRGAPLSVDGVALTALQVLSIYDQLTLPLRTMAERIRKGVTE